jgi:large subunit ribosomal protein L4
VAKSTKSTRKIYRQKGTGNARHGSRRAPIFVGGGVAHGPKPRKYTKKMPRKMRRAALRSALSVKASNGDILLLDDISMDMPKTKEMVALMDRLGAEGSACCCWRSGMRMWSCRRGICRP